MLHHRNELLSLVCFVCLAVSFAACQKKIPFSEKTRTLVRTLRSLNNALNFYSKYYHFMRDDAIFGLRVVQGFLHIALKKYKGNRSKEVHYSPAVLTYITHLMYKAKKIADKSIPVLERTLSEKDLRNNRPLFSNEWTYIHPYIELNRSLIFDFKTSNFGGKAMEPYAGKCWFNILGTYKKDTKRCTVPEICWKVMRRHNTYGAYLTHQTIYYGISEIMGCRTKFIELFGGEQKLEEMYLTLASNLYDQALDLYVNNFPKTSDHDNFLETLSFCGAFGLKECFNLKFLESAFTWQSRDGCVIDKTRINNNVIPDYCDVHTTAVFIGTLAIYVYWFLNPPSKA